MIEELERLSRRVIALPLAAPILLFGGMGLGDVVNRTLEVPVEAEATIAAAGAAQGDDPRIQIDALTRRMRLLTEDGAVTADYVQVYRDQIEPVEYSLRKWGVSAETARKVAWPLVEHATKNGLDPATVTAIVLVESGGRPAARSFVGARGLMQVMPDWSGKWGCGRDLYDIVNNLCAGTNILGWYLRRYDGNERRALLGYNGCVRGTNTPNCHTYPNKVWRLRQQIRADWAARRALDGGLRAASP